MQARACPYKHLLDVFWKRIKSSGKPCFQILSKFCSFTVFQMLPHFSKPIIDQFFGFSLALYSNLFNLTNEIS